MSIILPFFFPLFLDLSFEIFGEKIHSTRTRQSFESDLICKLDFSKVFDRLIPAYILNVLSSRGFPEKWVGWIRNVLCSSKLGDWIFCRRSLKQSDPLFLFLFILAVDPLYACKWIGLDRILSDPDRILSDPDPIQFFGRVLILDPYPSR